MEETNNQINEETNETKYMYGQNTSPDQSSTLEAPPQTTQKPKWYKRKGVKIVAGIIIALIIISSLGGPSKDEYNKLQKKYDEQTSELEAITSEYNAYKEKMSKFDGLTDEEIDALIEKADEITAEKKAADEAAAAEEAAKQDALNSATMSQKNALSKAQDYLAFTAFSYSGLISQLEYEGFSTEDATYAVDNCGADWNEQAAKKAQDYLDYSSFSRQGLIEQLEYEGFSAEQAEYGVTAVGY